MTVGPILDGPTLAAWLGGNPSSLVCDLVAAGVSVAVAAVVDPPPADAPEGWAWPDNVTLAATMVAADTYKAASGPGGGYQLDEVTYSVDFRIVSTLLRRYEPLLNPTRAVGGMVG